MSKPLVVSIPHKLGKAEALRRIRNGVGSARTRFGHVLSIEEETWNGDMLEFRVKALGQSASGTIEVGEEVVCLTVELPWLLARLAEGVQKVLRKEGTLLLEKKK